MATAIEKVRHSGLSTIAFLKAQLDSSDDRLSMFMPLVEDVLARSSASTFASSDVQTLIKTEHGLEIPQQTLGSLLGRACTRGALKRENGRYSKTEAYRAPTGSVADAKAKFESEQKMLGQRLVEFARSRGIELASSDDALDALTAFVEKEHVGLLLNEPLLPDSSGNGRSENLNHIIPVFVTTVVAEDEALRIVLNRILEGLVLYRAAFQSEASTGRTFRNLTAAFDSKLVCQAIGYEGESAQNLMRETIDVLKAANVDCIVFDVTVNEIQRILSMYQHKLATPGGRQSLHAVPMARHFLTRRYAPSDVAQMSALLEHDIRSLGLNIRRLPDRVPEYTADESALAKQLADTTLQDESEPRVLHDVDCVAGILVLRKGEPSQRIDNIKAVFATSSPLVLTKCGIWWREHEKRPGIEPAVHMRALANIAWLKRPTLSADFKLRELIALCTAAMRPGQPVWDRFLSHLKKLTDDKRLTSDEAMLIVASSLSDTLLRDTELGHRDADDIDASTMDEVVQRVKDSYKASAEIQLGQAQIAYDAKLRELEAQVREATGRADAAENAAGEIKRKHELRIDSLARFWGKLANRLVVATLGFIACFAAYEIVAGHEFPNGLMKYVVAAAIIIFMVLELLGVLHHVREAGSWVEAKVTTALRNFLTRERKPVSPWARMP